MQKFRTSSRVCLQQSVPGQLILTQHVRKRGWVKAVTQDKESSDALLVFFGNVKHLGYNRLTIMGTIVIAISVELYYNSYLRKED
eukprot:scaffold3357_cov268-Chaetoceros_neogracile.AAC.10